MDKLLSHVSPDEWRPRTMDPPKVEAIQDLSSEQEDEKQRKDQVRKELILAAQNSTIL